MVTGNGQLFETQYRTSSGSRHSGILNQSKCYDLAVEGKSYVEILHYFYDNSTNSSNTVIKFVRE
jgi:hypothetical protein